MSIMLNIINNNTLLLERLVTLGFSQEEKALSRERILDAAAEKIRSDGLKGFSIAGIMKDAGLTHGTFYAHFKTRQHLVACALERALQESKVVYDDTYNLNIKRITREYLSKTHRDSPATGCAISALASELARADEMARTVMSSHLEKYFEKLAEALELPELNHLAAPIACTMFGAITLSRLTNNKKISDKILKDAQQFILSTVEMERQKNSA